jgi:hypothetical protein
LADEKQYVFAPGEVVPPAVPAWMIEGDGLAAGRIYGFGAGMFPVIAALARKSQVGKFVCTSVCSGVDVLD